MRLLRRKEGCMIGLVRRRYMGSKDNIPSASSYIQNGLIALYDGIENAGAGIHDANATSWLNLANTSESITGIDNTFTWGDDYLLPPIVNGVGVIPSYKPLTIECVFQDVGTGAYIPLGLQVYWVGIRANDTINFSSGRYYVTLPNRTLKYSISGIMTTSNSSNNPSAIYLNGVSSMVSSAGMTFNHQPNVFNAVRFNYGTGTFKFFCIRLYNKQLTEQEVLANYAIDQQRFNLE